MFLLLKFADTNFLLNNLTNYSVSDSQKCQPEQCTDIIKKPASYLKILHQNIRSLNKNYHEFCILLKRLNIVCDIIVLSECWLSRVGALPSLDGFVCFSTANNFNQNDGVVVFIGKQLNVKITEIELCEANCLQIELEPRTVILAIYRPSEFKNVGPFLNSLRKFLETLKTYKNIILLGDININLLKYEENTLEYLDIISFNGLFPAHTLPTRKKSCLDHVIIKTSLPSYTLVLETAITDHESTFFCLKTITNTVVNNKVAKKLNLEGILSNCKAENFQFIYENKNINEITNLLYEIYQT